MTLTWVPNLFSDILPMYIGILFMVPFVVGLYHYKPVMALLFVVVLWVFAQGWLLDSLNLSQFHFAFPAEPWSDRSWFFNPFGWQLVFFTGFAFMAGWIPKLPIRRALIGLALAFVIFTIPFAFWGIHTMRRFNPVSMDR